MIQEQLVTQIQSLGNRLVILGWAVDSRLALAGGIPALDRRARLRQQAIVHWARMASPVYRELYRSLPLRIEHFSDLPPVTKPQLMARFDDWLTDPAVTLTGLRPWLADPRGIGSLYGGKYLIYATSGTTGEPAILVQDRPALSLYLASRVRMYPVILDRGVLVRVARGQGRSAALLATGGHFGGVVMAEWARRLHPLGRNLEVFSVAAPLAETVAGLNQLQPAIVSGYASAIALLTEEAAAGRLSIDPALVFSIAESLTPDARDRISAVWNARLIEGYGSSEAAVIAFGCREGNLHQNVDWVTLEPVDEHYRPVPAGTPSHTVLVTNLANRVQPIVRYDLGDCVTLDPQPCLCGSPLPVIRVEGRSGDILTLAAPGGETVRVLPLAIGSEAEEVAGVRRVQIIQVDPAALLVKLEPVADADRDVVSSDVQQRLAVFLARQGLANVSVAVSHDPPQQERSGKFRQVYRQTTS
jgi:phenylacetate-coenzyme A ligase PaaK-like adenylate-forming protein